MLFEFLLAFLAAGLPFGIAGGVLHMYDRGLRKPPAPRVERKPVAPTRFYDWEVDGL